MPRYTVLVMTDQTSPVKRLQVRKVVLQRGAAVAIVLLVLLLIGGIDYARKWRDNTELHTLRLESLSQREQIHGIENSLQKVDERLERIQRLERKLRVITNLPGVEDGAGMGGGVDESGAVEQGPAENGFEPLDAPLHKSGSLQPTGHVSVEGKAGSGREPVVAARLSRLRLESRRLGEQAAQQEVGLAQLVDHLQGQSRRLAATPSIWPVKGWLTSRFGPRISPFTNQRQFHAGIDISSANGTAVVAPASGKVVFAGRKHLLGKCVVIDHGYGIRTTYAHASKLHVRKGEHVERGDLLASVGSTGRSTGPHLHYSVALEGRAVNPLDYILN